jgi:hypothetical protein
VRTAAKKTASKTIGIWRCNRLEAELKRYGGEHPSAYAKAAILAFGRLRALSGECYTDGEIVAVFRSIMGEFEGGAR